MVVPLPPADEVGSEVRPATRYFPVVIDGVTTEGHCSGTGERGPTVILTHGNGGSEDQLVAVEEHMEDRVLVCAYTRPGTPSSAELPRQFIDEWLIAIEPTVRPSTLYSYRRNLRLHVLTHIGGLPLVKIDAGTLNALYARLLNDGNITRSGDGRPEQFTTSTPASIAP